ncbi:S-adenosyl-L-methionine-dependent methyltransferase [Pseudovirgaria hyperparasitica]|uniref:S-adenosyl-L-methionine-dependent methyltransferase n=1 Tax=Pseudovirgaria hyperparasitica TaxID=470096 RepID=A0A6A6VSX9_9PEZI|nr:S-adenosyl-L-methionine-dependent methyltransferase [Pseudovirgaria hyperparasitica]KAF2752864.1 S-adenosyl-L-methionine-dependent methyltransferase [Pseudovirgaria hyperparasitica]
MDALIASATALFKAADEVGRQTILDGLRNLSVSLETEQDSMQRVLYAQLQLPIVRIGCDIKLFKILADSHEALDSATLAVKTGVAPGLMSRILRYLASNGYVAETAKDRFAANTMTTRLTDPGFEGGVYHNSNTVGPAANALPDYLKKSGYKDVDNVFNTPLQVAHKTDQPAFIWMQADAERFQYFDKFMSVTHKGLPSWLDVYPYQEKVASVGPTQPLFVDIGGGIGHQSVAFREKVPDVPNTVILQDVEGTLAHAIKHPGVQITAHDFWQPQPAGSVGAKIYYLRNILHDYPDVKALELLQNVKDALAPGSVILIDDMVIPNAKAHWHATQVDITMMSCLASMERTEDQWFALIEKAGLKTNKIYKYTQSLGDSIIECVVAGGD